MGWTYWNTVLGTLASAGFIFGFILAVVGAIIGTAKWYRNKR